MTVASKPARCRTCGGPLTQRPTGRPRLFCNETCREHWRALMRRLEARPPAGLAPFHSAEQGERLRAIAAQLRADADACRDLGAELELVGDALSASWLFSVASALTRAVPEGYPPPAAESAS